MQQLPRVGAKVYAKGSDERYRSAEVVDNVHAQGMHQPLVKVRFEGVGVEHDKWIPSSSVLIGLPLQPVIDVQPMPPAQFHSLPCRPRTSQMMISAAPTPEACAAPSVMARAPPTLTADCPVSPGNYSPTAFMSGENSPVNRRASQLKVYRIGDCSPTTRPVVNMRASQPIIVGSGATLSLRYSNGQTLPIDPSADPLAFKREDSTGTCASEVWNCHAVGESMENASKQDVRILLERVQSESLPSESGIAKE